MPEHHFLEEVSHSSAPEVFLAAVAAKTEHIRIGASVLAAPTSHPSAIAERAAVLDLVSDGRVDLAIGRPATLSEVNALCRAGAAPADVWEECVRAVLQLWTRERCTLDGANFQMAERAVLPKPCQKPHPPLWAASETRGEEEAGALGLGLLTVAHPDAHAQAQQIAAYRNRLAACEPIAAFINDQVAVTDLLYCHQGDGEGIETGRRLMHTARDLTASHASARELGLAGAVCCPAGLAIGDPKSIIDTLRAWEAMGVDCANFRVNAADAVSADQIAASLRLFAAEVMPVFRRARTRVAAE